MSTLRLFYAGYTAKMLQRYTFNDYISELSLWNFYIPFSPP